VIVFRAYNTVDLAQSFNQEKSVYGDWLL